MGRTTWVKPMTLVQKFEANEPVAAAECYEIACESTVKYDFGAAITNKDIPYNGPNGMMWGAHEGYIEGNIGKVSSLPPSFEHNKNGCKTASHNVFRIEGNEITFLLEYNGDREITGDVDWRDLGSDGVLGTGDVVYWYTEKGAVRWNHWGRLQPISNDHPLRS